jgi:hypothetical protein
MPAFDCVGAPLLPAMGLVVPLFDSRPLPPFASAFANFSIGANDTSIPFSASSITPAPPRKHRSTAENATTAAAAAAAADSTLPRPSDDDRAASEIASYTTRAKKRARAIARADDIKGVNEPKTPTEEEMDMLEVASERAAAAMAKAAQRYSDKAQAAAITLLQMERAKVKYELRQEASRKMRLAAARLKAENDAMGDSGGR